MEPACYDADFIVCNGVYEPMGIIDTTGPEATQAVPEGFGFSASGKRRLGGFLYQADNALGFLAVGAHPPGKIFKRVLVKCQAPP